LPVPPAFVLPISLCARISAGDHDAECELDEGLRKASTSSSTKRKRFGDRRRPLLFQSFRRRASKPE